MKSVLITGANGFLGKECIKNFSGYDVITTDLFGDVDYKGDLSDDKFVNSLPDVDIVVNCAAVQYVSKNLPIFFRSIFFKKNNITTTELLIKKYSSTHFIHIGTSMMYKQTGEESYGVNSQMGGEGVYSYSKMHAQIMLEKNVVNLATVIPCIIGGEGREGLFVGFVKMISKFGFVIFPGTGNHKINMIHVSDVGNLIRLIVDTKSTGRFNAAAPDSLSIREWIIEIGKELKINNIHEISLPLTPIHILSKLTAYRLLAREQLLMLKLPHVLDIKSSLDIGWKPEFTNAQIVQDIAKSIILKNIK